MRNNPTATPVAIVGMACRLPQANNLEEYWRLLLSGRCTASELPPGRLDRELHYSPTKGVTCKTYTTLGCLVDYDSLDFSNVPLSQQEIADSDISHSAMAAVAAEACRHAGYDPFTMPDSFRQAGVYIGHVKGSERAGDLTYGALVEQTAQYLREVEGIQDAAKGDPNGVICDVIESIHDETERRTRDHSPNMNGSQCAALISKMLGLNGPFMVVNSACASSLQAIGLGVRQIQLGRVDSALVGGAAYCKFDSLVMFSQAHSVSATGTRPFDEKADGLVSGEGYVAFLLKPLEKALTDGDSIHAVIRSIGIASDGRGKSLWAPKKEGQITAMRRAYGGDLDASKLQYVEAHATSTQVGDQTEVQSIAESLSEHLPRGVKIPVGSVKGNIGHTIETAGAAGVLKTILAMKHETIPPTANVENLNSSIDWENAPLWVPTSPAPWPEQADGRPRRAAVNSFGIGGLNVHVVIDEGPTREELHAAKRISNVQRSAAEPEFLPVAIVGVGGVYPGARTAEALVELLREGRDVKCQTPPERWLTNPPAAALPPGAHLPPGVEAGYITDFEYDWRAHKVPPKQIAAADPLQFMLLDAVDQAIKSAGYDKREFDRERTGVCVGAITSGEFHEHLQMGLRLPEFRRTLAKALAKLGTPAEQIDAVADEYSKILLQRMPAITDETGSYTSNTLVSRITKTWNLMGGGSAIDAGGASAAAAIATCVDLLQAGDCKVMICAAGQRSMGYCTHQRYSLRNDLVDSSNKPAGGMVPGEGVGVLVLKPLADAERDGDQVLGVIRGVGASSAPDLSKAVAEAARQSLQRASISPDDVSYVETGLSGLAKNDSPELAGLNEVFRTATRRTPVPLGAVNGQLGYLGSGATLAAVLRAIHSLQDMKAFANVDADYLCALAARHQQCLSAPRDLEDLPVTTSDGRVFAGISATCLDQQAYHVVLQRPSNVPVSNPAPAKRSTDRPQTLVNDVSTQSSGGKLGAFRIARFAANTLPELLHDVSAALGDVKRAFAAASTRPFGSAACRLAIVCENGSEFEEKLRLANRVLDKPAAKTVLEEKGIYVSASHSNPKVAVLFPGHGSQYVDMLKPLVDGFTPAQRAFDRIEETLAQLRYPSFRDVAWGDGDSLGVDVWRTQLALLCADSIAYESLLALGVDADCVTGHSFGEFPALLAAGAWDFQNAVRATKARCAAIESTPSAGGLMMSVASNPKVLDDFDSNWAESITISVRNAEEQFVVGGELHAIGRLEEWLANANVQTRRLPAPRAFHTPLMKPVQPKFMRSLQPVALSPPRTPLLSSVTNRYVAEPAQIRENLVAQLTDPVNYLGLMERLRAEGFNVFVECGPHQILTKLHRRFFVDGEVVTASVDAPRRNPLRQLTNLRASLEVAGVFDTVEPRTLFPDSPPSSQPRAKGRPRSAEEPQAHRTQSATEVAPHVITLAGSPYEMGLQHGRRNAEPIRRLVRRYADLAGAPNALPDLSSQLRERESFFEASDIDEMRGVADGAGVAVESIYAHNLMLYPDSGAGCAHFALTGSANPAVGLLHATNEDQPLALSVRDCLQRCIQLRVPDNGIPHVVFSVVGQLAGINGINAEGIAVSSAMLLDIPRLPNTGKGLAQAAIVSRILARADTVEAAVEIAQAHCGAGGWSMCISRHQSDQLSYLEYDGRALQVRSDQVKILASNHCMLQSGRSATPTHSLSRLARLQQILGNGQLKPVSLDEARQALRDRFDIERGREAKHPTMNTVRRVDNQVSIVMQPGEGKVWVAERATAGSDDDYFELDVRALFDAVERKTPADTLPTQSEQLAEACESLAAAASAPRALEGDAAARALRDYGIAPSSTSTGSVCHRYVLRAVETEPPTGTPSTIGRSIVLGAGEEAKSLRDRLRELGADVQLVAPAEDGSFEAEALEQIWGDTPIDNVFVMSLLNSPYACSPEMTDWERRRQASVNSVFHLLQTWVRLLVEHDRLPLARLLSATRLGGDFSARRSNGVEGGAFCGLLKSLSIESGMKSGGAFMARAVDFEEHSTSASIAETLVRELGCNEREVEVGYIGKRRYVIRPVAETGQRKSEATIPTPQGAWVFTGGARGVTAVVARELGRRYALKLHLVGSSPRPQIDPSWRTLTAAQKKDLRSQVMKAAVAEKKIPAVEWARVERAIEIDRNLRELEASGIDYAYHVCDITDRAQLAETLAGIRARDGAIRGVVHGAGFESALRFEKKKPELIERTFAVKVDGAANLLTLTAQDEPDYFVAFGSVSGRFGGIGQADYSSANDMLSKLLNAYRHRHPNRRCVTFHWHAWDEVGMAVRPESSHLRDIGNVTYMPTREGVQHVVHELTLGAPESEIVITGWPFHKLDPKYVAKIGNDRVAPVERPLPRLAKPTTASPHQPVAPADSALEGLALIDGTPVDEPGEQIVTEIVMDPVRDAFLADHRYRERPLTPGVIAIEAFAQSAQRFAGADKQVRGLRDLRLLESQRFHSDDSQVLRVSGVAKGALLECVATSDLVNQRGRLLKADRVLYTATAEIVDRVDTLRGKPPTPRPMATWHDFEYREDLVIWHGPSLRCLQQVAVRGPFAWGRAKASDPRTLSPRREGRWLTPVAAIDAAFYTCGIHIRAHMPGVAMIPQSIAHLRWGDLPRIDERLVIWVSCNEMDSERADFDFMIFGEAGEPLVCVKGYEGLFVPQAAASRDAE